MRILDADKMFLGTDSVKRVFQGTDLVWPLISGSTDPNKTIMYVHTDLSGNTLSNGIDYLFDGTHNYFTTTEGKERPYYNRNGLMLFDNDLVECVNTFSYDNVPSGETPTYWLDVISMPPTLESLRLAFHANDRLRSINIPASVRNLNYALDQCHFLSGCTVPDGVTELNYTFAMCRRITYLYIPASVTSFEYPVSNAEMLTEINYGGTVAQWNSIQNVGHIYNADNTALQRIICTDGVITL